MVNGNLFGSLINIVRNTAPTMLVGLGMTLVIATRGVDLSVGAVAAIAGAAAATFIDSLGAPESRGHRAHRRGHRPAALGRSAACGTGSS